MDKREAVIAEARTWIGTPWHHAGRVKGAGVDCAMLLAEVFEKAAGLPRVEPADYPPDWFMHRDEERFLAVVEHMGGCEVEQPQPGDIAVYKFGRCFSHGAIVVAWPIVIHSFFRARKVEETDGTAGELGIAPHNPRAARARVFYQMVP